MNFVMIRKLYNEFRFTQIQSSNLSGSLPKSGPFIFASENQFLWNLAHQKGFVHN